MRNALVFVAVALTSGTAFAELHVTELRPAPAEKPASSVVASSSSTASDITPNLSPLKFAGELMLRPEDVAAGNYIAPSVRAYYKKGGAVDGFRFQVDVALIVQSPPSTTKSEPAQVARRVQLSGGVGNLEVSGKIGYVGDHNTFGVVLGPSVSGAWQNSEATASGTPPEPASTTSPTPDNAAPFVFGSLAGTAAAWGGPIYVGAKFAGHWVGGDPSLVAQSLHRTSDLTLLIGVALETYFLQLKYLVPFQELSGSSAKSSQRFDIRIGAAVDFL